MNGFLDRIVYAHRGSLDFRAVASSLGHDDRGWGENFRYYARLKFEPGRQPSTWYGIDRDRAIAAVIRRLPGDRGDGRDDRAYALFGSPDELDLQQALALATNCPLWADQDWRDDGPLPRLRTDRLPERLPLWEKSDVDAYIVDELWPIIHAVRRRPDTEIWVLDNVSEERAVSHIRAVAGMARILGPSDRLWTFATREDREVRARLVPRIRYVHGWGVTDVASDATRTVIHYDHHDATPDEEQLCRRLVTTYLTGGPTALEQELRPQPLPAPMPAPIPVAVGAAPTTPVMPQPNWMTDNVVPPPSPLQEIPPRQENALALFRELPEASADDLPLLVRRVTQASITDRDRESIRSELANELGRVRRRLAVAQQTGDQLLAQLLTMTAMRPDDWRTREAKQSVRRLLQAIGAPKPDAEPRRHGKESRNWSNLMPLALWLFGATILVLSLIVATTVTR